MLPFNPYPKEKQINKNTKTCKCGKEFKVKPCQMLDESKKYCSNECRHKYSRTSKKATIKSFNCDFCGKYFERALGQWNRLKHNFCSNECYHKHQRTGEIRKCLNCDKEFYTSVSKNKKYCSKKCDSIFNPRPGFITNANNAGEKNGQFKHGKYAGRSRPGGSSLKVKIKKAVIERDGHYCLLCGKPGPGLHLHRVVYGSECGKYELENCVQLCNVDHALVHSNKKVWKPILQKYLLEKVLELPTEILAAAE